MSPESRRRFIKKTGIGVAPLTTAPTIIAADSRSQILQREQRVPGVHVYSMRESVSAGDEIPFCVSADRPYGFTVVRLGHDPDSPDKDEVLHRFDAIEPRVQPIHPGSYILV